jgi:hypothetical protein
VTFTNSILPSEKNPRKGSRGGQDGYVAWDEESELSIHEYGKGKFMEEPREITVSITDRFFTLDLPIEDEQLIGNVLLGLAQYVKEGLPIKVKEAYLTFSGTEEIMTKVISTTKQVAEWGKEIKGLITAIKKRE